MPWPPGLTGPFSASPGWAKRERTVMEKKGRKERRGWNRCSPSFSSQICQCTDVNLCGTGCEWSFYRLAISNGEHSCFHTYHIILERSRTSFPQRCLASVLMRRQCSSIIQQTTAQSTHSLSCAWQCDLPRSVTVRWFYWRMPCRFTMHRLCKKAGVGKLYRHAAQHDSTALCCRQAVTQCSQYYWRNDSDKLQKYLSTNCMRFLYSMSPINTSTWSLAICIFSCWELPRCWTRAELHPSVQVVYESFSAFHYYFQQASTDTVRDRPERSKYSGLAVTSFI